MTVEIHPRGTQATAQWSRTREFVDGVRDTLPLILAAVPFGLIFGTLATNAGLSPVAVIAMSVFVYSGSAQFLAILLLGSGSAVWVIWFATLVLNLRHLLYAATLVGHVRHLSQGWRFVLAAWLTDETFAVMDRRYRARGTDRLAHWYYLGSIAGMYVNWILCTALGMILGQQIPGIKGLGLEFAMVATFIAIVMPALRSAPYWAAAVAAGLVAAMANGLPYKLGLMLGALTGIAVGVLLDWRMRGRAAADAGVDLP